MSRVRGEKGKARDGQQRLRQPSMNPAEISTCKVSTFLAAYDPTAVERRHLAGHVGGVILGEKRVEWRHLSRLAWALHGHTGAKFLNLLGCKVDGFSGVQIGRRNRVDSDAFLRP